MTLDQELEQEFRELGEHLQSPTGDLSRVMRRGRARRLARVAASAAAVVVGAAAVAAISALLSAPPVVPADTTGATPTTSAATTSTSVVTTTATTVSQEVPAAVADGGLLIATYRGVMVAPFSGDPVLLPTDGRQVRWVAADGAGGFVYQMSGGADLMRLEAGASQPSVLWSSSGDDVVEPVQAVGVVDGSAYVVTGLGTSSNQVLRVPLDGGRVEVVAQGLPELVVESPHAASSPMTDGQVLAWYHAGPIQVPSNTSEACHMFSFLKTVFHLVDLTDADRDLSALNPFPEEGGSRCPRGQDVQLRVGGGRVLWLEESGVAALDLASGEIRTLPFSSRLTGGELLATPTQEGIAFSWDSDQVGRLHWPEGDGYGFSEIDLSAEVDALLSTEAVGEPALALYTEPISLAADASLLP